MHSNKIIGFVSAENPFTDRSAWSGTIYKIRESIEKAGYPVKWIKSTPPKYLVKTLGIYLKLRYGFTQHHPFLFKLIAKYTDWVSAKQCDILFFPGGAQIMNHAPVQIPYIYYTDACFNQMVDYYWFNINNRLIKLANEEESKAIKNAFLNIKSSDWANNYAIEYYKCSRKKNIVIEFGANLDEKDIVETLPYKSGRLNIFFSGVDWNRKGGEIAIDTITILREKYNIDATLTIVGIKDLPERYKKLPYVRNLGFLNKNKPEEYSKYIDVIKQSHILLLPTKAECSAIVFCEAAAYGLPVYTHDTGGIANYVVDDFNGHRLSLGCTGEDFARKIYESICNSDFQRFHENSLSLYKKTLNWDKWSERFAWILKEMLDVK